MYELKKKLERYLRVNLLGPGPRLIKKKNLPGRGLTKLKKHWTRRRTSRFIATWHSGQHCPACHHEKRYEWRL